MALCSLCPLRGVGFVAILFAALAACSPASPSGGGVGERPGGAGGGTGGTGADAPDTEPPASPPWILSTDLVNARDVGGLPAGASAQVARGLLFRGPPLQLTASGCDEFADLGIRTVIDLRVGSERTATPTCVTNRARLVLAPLPVPYAVSPADYIAIIDTAASIAEAFRVLGDAASYPVYVHCTWGRDRTGVVFALILLSLGVSEQAILQEYLLSDESVGAYPASLQAALNEIDRRGGIGPYLTAAGVTEAQLAALRARVLAPLPGP